MILGPGITPKELSMECYRAAAGLVATPGDPFETLQVE